MRYYKEETGDDSREFIENRKLDPFIGKKVKQRRMELGMTQSKLGEKLGITFQQIQKYENGKNRISASTLFRISQILGVNISYFVEGAEKSFALKDDSSAVYQIQNKEALNLINYFSSIPDASTRKKVLDLVKAIAVKQN